MQVTRLEIFGFKSFVERFVLNFDRNLIGIVGPNGCGKSNVVDSLRWVLGETHARHLRGTVLDDLIFSGSDSRRPLGMAEVSITIRPNRGWQEVVKSPVAPIQLAKAAAPKEDVESEEGSGEISLTEQGSNELPIEADSPAENHSDNQTARIDLSPGDNVGVEAAAALKLMEDVGNLEERGELPSPVIFSEIPGLLGAAEIQFTRRLYRSGESEYFINRVPCRLRDMLDIYRIIGLGARGLSIVEQGEIGQFISKKPVERRELLEEAAGISGFRTKMEAAQRKLEKTTENLARLKDIVLEVEKQVRVLSRQAKRARERNEIKSELRQYDFDLYHGRTAKIKAEQAAQAATQEQLEQELERLKAEYSVSEAEQGELQAQLETFDVSLADIRRQRDGFQLQLAQERERLNDLKVQAARLSSRREALATRSQAATAKIASNSQGAQNRVARAEELKGKLIGLEEKQSEIQGFIEQLSKDEVTRQEEQSDLFHQRLEYPRQTEIHEEIERLQPEVELLPNLSSSVSQAERAVREAQSKCDQQMKSVQQNRVALARTESELRSLEAQLEAFAEHVTRAAGAEDLLGSGEGINKVLLAGLRVPEELQAALSAVLGDREQYLVTASAKQLGQRYGERRSNQNHKEPVKFGVIDERGSVAAALLPLTEAERELAPSARHLVECIGVDSEFLSVATAVLGEYLLVDTLEQALQVNEANSDAGRPRRSFVTRSGEVVTPWGWYTTQGRGKSFGFTRRMAEQQEVLANQQLALQNAEAELVILEEGVSAARKTLVECQEERERALGLERRLHALRREEQELRRQVEAKLRDEERNRRATVMAKERELQTQLRGVSSEAAQVRSEIDFEMRQQRTLLAEIEELQGECQRSAAEVEEIVRQEELLTQQLVSDETEGNTQLSQLRESCLSCDAKMRDLEEQRNPLKLRLGEVSQSVSELRSQTSRLQEQLNRASLQVEKGVLELQMLFEELCRTYSDSPVATEEEIEAVRVRAGADLDAFIKEALEESQKLRRRIEREGEVDPQSIEMFEQEDLRLNTLRSQSADLEQATEILSRTIRQLKEISRARFLHTFEVVSKKFSELVPRLFGGGAGHMQLINPDDPLQSGVEVFVRPPGKKISNMELLSGGEKALVALSVLIAMFLHRPSPICVLDEVDAPLDEANLERYLDLIREISATTQFLVITHNKRTMAQADRLIGITMQERGVSTALTVRFEEAETEIDRWVANA